MKNSGWQSIDGKSFNNMGLLKSLHTALIKLVVGRASVMMNLTIEMEAAIPGSVPIQAQDMKCLLMDRVYFVNLKNCRFNIKEYTAKKGT